ncbi:MAG: hypothetical protein HYX83_01195 [Chloroflexi bacterium]|nr:hypothetical protein [Chloroflexota bacterium]
MKRLIILLGIFAILAALTAGCAGQPPAVSHGGPVKDYVSLIDNLRAVGATVEPAGEVFQDFFSVTGRAIMVNGENVQVFEYPGESLANAEASTISPDGSTITTKDRAIIVDWIAAPHFYKAGRVLVLYVGDGASVVDLLEAALGPQFAGTKPDL